MNAMTGQLDLLELVADDLLAAPPKFRGFPRPTEPAIPESPLTCPACGETEPNAMLAHNNHHIMPIDTREHGHPVCIGMNLTRNHVHYYLKRASGHVWPGETPMPCCYDKHGIHGKKISKPTRTHYLDHAKFDLARAAKTWRLHLPSLIKAVADLRTQYGITPDEAPVITESEHP